MNNWLRTDEFEEAVSALEMVPEAAAAVSNDIYRWKWVILAVHNALQGFMVLALRGGNGLAALRDDVAQAWLEAYRQGTKYPRDKLDSFLNLYKKIKSDRMLFYVTSLKFVPKGSQGRSIKKLNALRNNFIHFIPKGWSLEVSGLPEICLDSLAIINFLGWESGNIIFHKTNMASRAKKALDEAQRILEDLKHKYFG